MVQKNSVLKTLIGATIVAAVAGNVYFAISYDLERPVTQVQDEVQGRILAEPIHFTHRTKHEVYEVMRIKVGYGDKIEFLEYAAIQPRPFSTQEERNWLNAKVKTLEDLLTVLHEGSRIVFRTNEPLSYSAFQGEDEDLVGYVLINDKYPKLIK